MAFVTSHEMLRDAQRRGYAVGAFNIENMEMAQAVIAAAEETESPVMLQTTSGTLRYADSAVYAAMVSALAKQVKVPVCMHLDHGNSYDLAARCLMSGYTSVMIDGSQKPFEENVAVSRDVVHLASLAGVPVEAELGKVGGKEDDAAGAGDAYTEPDKAAEFVERTGVSSLAVAIGTAHGVYKEKPVLDVERLKQIRKVVEIPLVLHGASGLSVEQVQECIRFGICKVNFATELRIAYTNGVKEALLGDPFDPKVYGKQGRESVKQLVMNWMRVCGAAGKA